MTEMRPLTRIAMTARSAALRIASEQDRAAAAAEANRLKLPDASEIGEVKRSIAIATLRLLRLLPQYGADPSMHEFLAHVLRTLADWIVRGPATVAPAEGGGQADRAAADQPHWWVET